ncbi:MAG TPA: antitoxin Xre-like helix-turn-helix domain-containing protein [Hanamia sp.]|jgi:putative toxin-antitoxin system antitoxin component (TIGR02293 family)|nr:antitoxin Xre-like helix-turn-helix domain-containing protein [Hanamia sp.]
MKKIKKYKEDEEKPMMAEEPMAVYETRKRIPFIKEFTFNDFKKISEKVDFTQKEWADILHISERTLQRYAHGEGSFNSGAVDRILQINKVFDRGNEVFGGYDRFNRWLRDNPYMLEGRLSIHSLASFEGINNIVTQIGRIEHGILA